MKRFPFLLFIICLPLFSLYARNEPSVANTEENLPDPSVISEAFGHILAKNLTDNTGFRFDPEKIIKGIRDATAGLPSPLSEEQYEKAISLIQQKYFNELATENLTRADAFMENNLLSGLVRELVPGKLQITVIREGTGPAIEPHHTPLIHYIGRYPDETIFSSSEESGEPVVLQLDQTIPGFRQGLIGAKEGETRRLFIHPDLGYGMSDLFQPNSLMIFDITVLKADETEKTTS